MDAVAPKPIGEMVTVLRWNDADQAALEAAVAPVAVRRLAPDTEPDAIVAALGDAEALVLSSNAFPALLRAPGLRWVHVDHAGLDGYVPTSLLAAPFRLTSSAGRSAEALAEHALMFMLALNHRLPELHRRQRRRVWSAKGLTDLRALRGRRVLIVGAGHTGTAVASACAALGMEVHGFRRRAAEVPAGFAVMHAGDEGARLVDAMENCDVVVLAASLNNGSRHLVGRAELAALRDGAIVVNIGRGALIDEAALVDALRAGRIAGAGLDVTDPEPLPLSSPLWRCPNVLLTPHVTPALADRTQRSIALLAENIARLARDLPLANQLGPGDAYDAPPPNVRQRAERSAGRRWRRTWHRLSR